MKKLSLLFCLLFTAVLFSQETTTTTVTTVTKSTPVQINDTVKKPQNEFKFGVVALFVGVFAAEYERIIDESSSAGVRFQASFDTPTTDYNNPFFVSGYYRAYFGDKYAEGLFIEGFLAVNTLKTSSPSNNGNPFNQTTYDTNTNLGVGFGAGKKWVSRSGITFELQGGLARNLTSISEQKLFVQGSVSVGYRFN